MAVVDQQRGRLQQRRRQRRGLARRPEAPPEHRRGRQRRGKEHCAPGRAPWAPALRARFGPPPGWRLRRLRTDLGCQRVGCLGMERRRAGGAQGRGRAGALPGSKRGAAAGWAPISACGGGRPRSAIMAERKCVRACLCFHSRWSGALLLAWQGAGRRRVLISVPRRPCSPRAHPARPISRRSSAAAACCARSHSRASAAAPPHAAQRAG